MGEGPRIMAFFTWWECFLTIRIQSPLLDVNLFYFIYYQRLTICFNNLLTYKRLEENKYVTQTLSRTLCSDKNILQTEEQEQIYLHPSSLNHPLYAHVQCRETKKMFQLSRSRQCFAPLGVITRWVSSKITWRSRLLVESVTNIVDYRFVRTT